MVIDLEIEASRKANPLGFRKFSLASELYSLKPCNDVC